MSQSLTNRPDGTIASGLLPWEDADAFHALRLDWRIAYDPKGPAEEGLIDQLVWIEWRRRRLVLAERALHMGQADSRVSGEHGKRHAIVARATVHRPTALRKYASRTVLQTETDDDQALREDAVADREMTEAALRTLDADGDAGFEAALAALRADSRDYWADVHEDEPERYPGTADGLRRFIELKLLPLLDEQDVEAADRADVRLQVIGESVDPIRMEKLLALDERLTRQYEKALGMLIRLQEMRAKVAVSG